MDTRIQYMYILTSIDIFNPLTVVSKTLKNVIYVGTHYETTPSSFGRDRFRKSVYYKLGVFRF